MYKSTKMLVTKSGTKSHRVDILRTTPMEEIAELINKSTIVIATKNSHWPIYTYKFEGCNFSGIILVDGNKSSICHDEKITLDSIIDEEWETRQFLF